MRFDVCYLVRAVKMTWHDVSRRYEVWWMLMVTNRRFDCFRLWFFPCSPENWRLLVLLLWTEALMSFYELYSANIPLLIPSAEWMYRLLYMRGQLSVGERVLVPMVLKFHFWGPTPIFWKHPDVVFKDWTKKFDHLAFLDLIFGWSLEIVISDVDDWCASIGVCHARLVSIHYAWAWAALLRLWGESFLQIGFC